MDRAAEGPGERAPPDVLGRERRQRRAELDGQIGAVGEQPSRHEGQPGDRRPPPATTPKRGHTAIAARPPRPASAGRDVARGRPLRGGRRDTCSPSGSSEQHAGERVARPARPAAPPAPNARAARRRRRPRSRRETATRCRRPTETSRSGTRPAGPRSRSPPGRRGRDGRGDTATRRRRPSRSARWPRRPPRPSPAAPLPPRRSSGSSGKNAVAWWEK